MLPFKLVSADSHVVEPPELWIDRIDRRFRHQAPRMVQEADGDFFLCEGALYEKCGIGTFSSSAKKSEDIRFTGRWDEILPGAYDPAARLADMERDSMDAELLYSTLGIGMFAIADLDFQFACFQAFNDWLAEYCAGAPGRLFGAAMIPTDPIQRGVAEMNRCARMGLKAAEISVSQDAVAGYEHPMYEPLWAAAQDLQMPVSLHVAANKKPFATSASAIVDFVTIFVPAMQSITAMIFGGVFDRHRQLKVASVENDAAWATAVLERMDYRYQRDPGWIGYTNAITSGRTPSDIFREQVACTFMRDRTAVKNRDLIGLKSLMWGSDYPHFDGTWPRSVETLEEQFKDVPVRDQVMIARRNAIEFYRLPLQP